MQLAKNVLCYVKLRNVILCYVMLNFKPPEANYVHYMYLKLTMHIPYP
jgi:hypothetical protein